MDSLFVDNVKEEKANAMKRYQRLRKITNLFRFFEICVALILFSWFSTRLPVAVKISFDFFRDFCIVLVSPRFVFFVGNAIVLTLFAKSGQFSDQNGTRNSSGTDLYDEFIKNQKIRTDISPPASPELIVSEEISPPDPPELVICEEKQIVLEESPVTVTYPDTKVYQRSQSEISKNGKVERELRRSKTEKSCRVEISDEKVEINASSSSSSSTEEMSNEEFQRTIEAFIAKQVKFLKEESMAIVLQS